MLPTWQWRLENADGSPATDLTVDYDDTRAFDGPTSLRVAAALAAGGTVRLRLFKTALPVGPHARLGLTCTTGSAGVPSNLRVGLTFQDAPDDVVWLEAGNTTQAGWDRRNWPLSRHTGRTVAAVGLGTLTR